MSPGSPDRRTSSPVQIVSPESVRLEKDVRVPDIYAEPENGVSNGVTRSLTLNCIGISKSFPGVKSLDGVDFSVEAGEVHALLGENGAGKSTLVKAIAGAYQPDAGTIVFDGGEVCWSSPKAARRRGIHVIFQELVLFPELSVAENIFIGEEPHAAGPLISYRKMKQQSIAILDSLGVEIDPLRKVRKLSIADQQMVEIAKALVGKVRLLILDEPTAVISGREVGLLFERLRKLRQQGVAIVYISHRLEEIFQIADRVTVLKDGKLVGVRRVAEVDRTTLVRMMVGRDLQDLYPPRSATAAVKAQPVLEVRDLSIGQRVKRVSFSLCRGEVLGLAGLIGAGRTELALGIFGALPVTEGSLTLAGEPYRPTSPKAAIRRGLGLLTEDRKEEGLLLGLGVAANITAPKLQQITRRGVLDLRAEERLATGEISKFLIRASRPKAPVFNLSGGNQQKILFSRWTLACQRVLILDEPTRGVDVGAKAEIYRIIRVLADEGVGVLMISSELQEILGMCDRVLVMRQGELTGELSGDQVTEEAIMHLATFHSDGGAVE
jgi:ribose transport system ATP-binding protein